MTAGLTASTTYFFAMKAQDEVPNVSAMSNVPSLATLVAPTITPLALTLSLSGMPRPPRSSRAGPPRRRRRRRHATSYDLRYSTAAIVTAADFAAAAPVTGEPVPAIAGASQSMTVSGLTASTTYFFRHEGAGRGPERLGDVNVPSLATL
jgi:hypothetical protein